MPAPNLYRLETRRRPPPIHHPGNWAWQMTPLPRQSPPILVPIVVLFGFRSHSSRTCQGSDVLEGSDAPLSMPQFFGSGVLLKFLADEVLAPEMRGGGLDNAATQRPALHTALESRWGATNDMAMAKHSRPLATPNHLDGV